MRITLLAFCFLLCTCVCAQIPVTPEFAALLDSMDVRINHPLDADFQLQPNVKNHYHQDQLTVYSKREKLEIRYHLTPESAADAYYLMPHMRAATLVMNLSSNEEDAVTTVHSFGEEEMAIFNADWARMYTFRPKRNYSDRGHAQLIAIYKEGSGMAFVVLLFRDAPATIEGRQLALRFR
jgi:hypothetical protein